MRAGRDSCPPACPHFPVSVRERNRLSTEHVPLLHTSSVPFSDWYPAHQERSNALEGFFWRGVSRGTAKQRNFLGLSCLQMPLLCCPLKEATSHRESFRGAVNVKNPVKFGGSFRTSLQRAPLGLSRRAQGYKSCI